MALKRADCFILFNIMALKRADCFIFVQTQYLSKFNLFSIKFLWP